GPAEDAVRDALSRADRPRRCDPGRRQLPRVRARMEGRHHLPAQDRPRPLGSQLRHPGRAARRPAGQCHRPCARDPRRPRARRADPRRTPVGQRHGVRSAAAARALPVGRARRWPAQDDCGARSRSHDADGGAHAAGGVEEHVVSDRPAVRKRDVLASLGQPKVAVMLMLGFSSGLPFFLSGNTLGYWLRDAGTTLAAIGFLSWVGLAYSLKFLWAPIIDRVDAPIFGRLGRRRGWMIVSQILVAAGLTGLSVIGLSAGLATVGAFALVVAFSSSTQDIVVDAWRIEAASDSDELGLLSSAYQLGYRFAILITDALILIMANHFGWNLSYGVMAALMIVGVAATFAAMEPRRVPATRPAGAVTAPLTTFR